jgi:hypothetical protein
MVFRFFIPGFLIFSKMAVSQLSVSGIDTLNVKMLNNVPVDLSKLGTARMELKDGVILFNCTITEISQNKVVYKKRNTFHDQSPDKIKKIRFEDQPWYLEFDRSHRGYLKPSLY